MVFLEIGDIFQLGVYWVDMLYIFGYIIGVVVYIVDGKVFIGDTLFYVGCG